MMQVMNPNHMAAIAASQNQPPVEQVDLQQQNTRGPVKLFVGQVPGVCTEEMLQPLFQEFGTVMEVSIMRDKTTNRSKGSAWVTYADRSSAETAISMLHNQHIIPPQTNPLQIKLANSPPQIQSKMMHSANNPLFGQQQHILKQLTYLNKYGGHTHPSRGGRKVFIGQIPRNYTSAQLEELMGQYGTIEETVILQDKATGVGRGCAFVVYAAREEAQRSIEELHGKKSLPPMANPMQVSLAEGEMEDQEPKLFVGMVPYKATEADIHQVFEHYGEIIEVALLKAPSGMSRGCAFVKYGDMAAAEAAVQNLHGNFKMEGGTSALTVKFADSEKEKKKRQKLKQSLGRLNMMGGQMGLPGMGMCGISGGMPGGAGMPGNAIPGGMPGGMGAMGMGAMGMGAMGGMGMGNMAAMGGAGMGGKGGGGGGRPAAPLANIAERKASGPPGANCFILHLPLSWGDEELREHFLPFGEIISATVFRDRYSGHAKGFGFVSYADPESAQQAITAMSGYQIPGHTEKLKVQLKNNDKAQQGGGMRRAPAPAGVPEPTMSGTAAPAPSASIPPIPAAGLN